ncbi:MAG: MC/SLC25 family protein [archaeon]|nr:MC/SLC25 family protein [archaeon]
MIKQHVLVPYRREDGSVPTIYTLAAGGTAGAVAQTVAFPFDVVRRRMQVSTFVPNSPQYSGIFDAFRKIWKGEGYLGFSRGISFFLISILLLSFTHQLLLYSLNSFFFLCVLFSSSCFFERFGSKLLQGCPVNGNCLLGI